MSAFTKEKIAVLGPTESATVMMTIAVKPGLRLSCLAANLRYCPQFSIEHPPCGSIYNPILLEKYVDSPPNVPLPPALALVCTARSPDMISYKFVERVHLKRKERECDCHAPSVGE